jgi:hypothetical protein
VLEEPLAQLVEHLTFNQGVLGSIPRRLTTKVTRSPDLLAAGANGGSLGAQGLRGLEVDDQLELRWLLDG